MSGLVFAGSAQFIAVGLWSSSDSRLRADRDHRMVNLRHLLMSAAIGP